jgi:hypothetical protein
VRLAKTNGIYKAFTRPYEAYSFTRPGNALYGLIAFERPSKDPEKASKRLLKCLENSSDGLQKISFSILFLGSRGALGY